MENKIELKNYGFNPDLVKIKPEDYIFGSALPFIVIKKDGQFDDFLPIYEPQAEKYETSGCTDWGGQNQVEIYSKKVFGFEPNYWEAFNYILAGITREGANPQNAYESFRNDGMIDEVVPMPDTYEEFSDPKQITEERRAMGKKWKDIYDFKHEWITNPTPEIIKNALPFGPVALGVTAWIEQDGLYIDNGQPNNHWCVCYGYIEDERGIILKIFDSYNHSKKLLHPDHKISVAKRIHIAKKKTYEEDWNIKPTNWFVDLLKVFWLAFVGLLKGNLKK